MAKIVDSQGNTLINTRKQPTNVMLGTGLSIWTGVVSEEYLAELKPWSKAFKVLNEMYDDAVIGTLYESVRTPLLDAKFSIEPRSGSQSDLDAANFLKSNTIESEAFSWEEHVKELLDALSFGFSINEKVLEKRKDGRLYIADIMPIGQETLYKWGDTDSRGHITSFIQGPYASGKLSGYSAAPMEKLIHFPFRARKRNPMGNSLSRSLYRAWYFRKNLEIVEAIGVERDVGNVPLAELGEGFYSPEGLEELKKALDGLRVDETSYVIAPYGTTIKPFGSGGKVYDVRTIIRDYDHKIRQRFFMDFISLGSEQVGTQALAKEVTGFFSLSLGAVQREMLRVWQRQLVPWLFKWNNTQFNIDTLPRIKWSKPGKINIQSLAQSVGTLLGANAVHWSPALEHFLREQFEFPPITDDEILELRNKEQGTE